MRKPHPPSAFQLEALRGAVASGHLRRLPGGFWVVGEYPDVPRAHVPAQWLSTQTIHACTKRGWLDMPNYYTALLTDSGREALAMWANVATSVPPHNRLR